MLVSDGDGVHALPVGPDDGVGLQAEDNELGDGADDGHGPGNCQQPPGAVHRGHAANREHYRTQPGVSTNSIFNDPFYSHYCKMSWFPAGYLSNRGFESFLIN